MALHVPLYFESSCKLGSKNSKRECNHVLGLDVKGRFDNEVLFCEAPSMANIPFSRVVPKGDRSATFKARSKRLSTSLPANFVSSSIKY